MSADGGRLEVAVVATRECAWTATVDASWAQVAPSSGQGEGTVVVTVAANPQASARSTSIALNGARTMLAQAPAPCRYVLGSNRTEQPAAGGSTAVQVTATSGCSWTASSSVSWVSVSPASGEGGVTATVRVDANSGAARTTQISIGGQPFIVEQEAYVAPPPSPAPAPAPPRPAPPTPAPPTPAPPTPGPPTPAPPAPAPPAPAPPTPAPPGPPAPSPSCTFAIDPSWRGFNAKKHDGDVDIRTTSGCASTARSNASWIEVTRGETGTGSRTVRYEVSRNDSPLPRAGTLTIAGHLHTVWQDARGRDDDDD